MAAEAAVAGLSSYYSAAAAALAVAAMMAAEAALAASAAETAAALSGLLSCFAAAVAATNAAAAAARRNANKYVIPLFSEQRLNNHKGIALTYTKKCMFLANFVGGLILIKALFFLILSRSLALIPSTISGCLICLPLYSSGSSESPISTMCPSGSKKRNTFCPHACLSMPCISGAPASHTHAYISSRRCDSK